MLASIHLNKGFSPRNLRFRPDHPSQERYCQVRRVYSVHRSVKRSVRVMSNINGVIELLEMGCVVHLVILLPIPGSSLCSLVPCPLKMLSTMVV